MEREILEQIEQLFFDYLDKDVDEFCEDYVGEENNWEAVFSFVHDWFRIFHFCTTEIKK